ncbi:type II toxin-antitoxin system VapC family toxin [Mucilaginibacter ginkgonis]|uniref:Type II toxin-antitoxin system VapC family toxin n=1 Tax=Mucilaginibacter ginkgonis TaxID=2682091 RepID=A0A7T7F9G9_9SPHI|nr:type II toxin-antitoxin system VapC family toxin [Mucilaginibacter ginkgonis]
MNIYIDTSSLFKLYHEESGSDELLKYLEAVQSLNFFISAITPIEFTSTLYKKLRTKEIDLNTLQVLEDCFRTDIDKFQIVPISAGISQLTSQLFSRYGQRGLRSLDALQLCSSLLVKPIIDVVITSDNLLSSFFRSEGFEVFVC